MTTAHTGSRTMVTETVDAGRWAWARSQGIEPLDEPVVDLARKMTCARASTASTPSSSPARSKHDSTTDRGLDEIVDRVCRQFGARSCRVGVRQEDGSHLWIGPDMADASTAGGDERTEPLVGKSDRGFAHGLSPGIDVHELHTSRTLAGRAFRSSEPVTFNAQDPQTGHASLAPAEGRAVVREGIKSAVAVQLSSTRRTYGCLVLCSTDPLPTVSPEDIALTQVIAGQVAVAIERAQLYEDTKQRAAESEALYLFGQKLAARNAVEAAK